MKDTLTSVDRLFLLCMSVKGMKEASVRLGTRVYSEQNKYSEYYPEDTHVMKKIEEFAKYGKDLMKKEREVSQEEGKLVRLEVENRFQGNTAVYQVADMIIEMSNKSYKNNKHYKEEIQKWEKSYLSGLNRSGADFNLKEQSKEVEGFRAISTDIAKLSSFEISLEDLNYKRVGEHNKSIKASKKGDKYKSIKQDKSVTVEGLNMYVMGEIVALVKASKTFLMTRVHFTRLMNLLSSLRNSMMLSREIETTLSPLGIAKTLLSPCIDIAREDSNYVGEAMKAARQITILSMEESNIMGKSVSLYKETLSELRLEKAEQFISAYTAITPSKIILVNLLGFYTSLPHPDIPLAEVFLTIEGVKDPNRVAPDMQRRFEGTLRRTIFNSMRRSGHDVRLISTGTLSEELVKKANDVTQSVSAVLSYSSLTWSYTEFQEVRSIKKMEEMEVPIASKASSAGILMTTSEEQEAIAYYAGYGKSVTAKLLGPTTINDASEEIKGNTKFNIEKAIKRFNKVIDLHEKFESKYSFQEIEDIPSADLEKFLETHPMAEYVVNTEGKFGEVHKKVTRLFYIAEQQLKALTQRVERLVKQITRKQMGVSIVKGYLGRRTDLESSVNSMVGKTESLRSIAVSFDMSEFSKKFPMALVRSYGKILREITTEGHLDRIDLFFRATKVMLTNRGIYQHLRGARGGFEGFLNFTWSSIHAAIMEVSLEVTGLQGELMTFSDDGLLIFYPRSTESDAKIAQAVEKIRDTYADLGLNFHLGKTLVSDHMWEYLGDVCYNNRLIPMWFKVMTKMGRIVSTKGFNAMYDRIKTVNSQASAMIVASADPLTAYTLKRYICGRILRKWMPENEFLLEEVLLRLPTTCGGLRINSPYEDCINQTIHNDSEIYADLVLLDRLERGTFARVSSSILSCFDRFRETPGCMRSLLVSPTLFRMVMDDTSGSVALNWLLTRVRETLGYKLPKDPLNKNAIRDVYSILTETKNVDLNSIALILNNVPGLSAYRSHVGVLRGDGALKIAKRSHLRRAQAMDTKSLKKSVNFWNSVLKSYVPAVNRRFLEECFEMSFPSLDVVKPRPSPRMILVRTEDREHASLVVTIQHSRANNIYEAEYKEPTLKTPLDPTTLQWHSEATGDNETRDIRKMLAAVQIVISQHPNSEETIRNICDVFNCKPPMTLAGRGRGANRQRKGVIRPIDARVILPRYHMSKMSHRYLHALSYFLNSADRADRTTYGYASEVLTYFYDSLVVRNKSYRDMSVHLYHYKVENDFFEICFRYKEMEDTDKTQVLPPDTKFSVELRNEYIAYMDEMEQQRTQVELLDLSKAMAENRLDESANVIIGGMIKVLENYFVSMFSMSRSTILSEASIPKIAFLRTYVISRAIVGATLTIMNPMVRTKLSMIVSNMAGRAALENELTSPEFTEFLTTAANLYMMLPQDVRAMTPKIGKDLFRRNKREYMNILSAQLFNYSLLSTGKVTLFFSKDFRTNQFSNDHKVAYRKIFRETVISIYSEFRRCRWDENEFRRRHPNVSNLSLDEQIDMLKVTYLIIRASKHRIAPYNTRSSLLLLKRFYTLVVEIINFIDLERQAGNLVTAKDTLFDVFEGWVPDEDAKASIRNIIYEAGTDMLENISKPIEPTILRRAIYHARKYWHDMSLPRCITANLEIQNMEIFAMQTAFHETLSSSARAKVKAYHHGLGRLLGKEFMNLTRDIGPVAGIRTDTDGVTGLNIFDEDMEISARTLIINHLEILKHQYGFLGFRNHRTMTGLMGRDIATVYGLEEVEAAPEVGTLESDSEFKIFDITCSNIGKALTTYTHLSNTTMSSISILKDDRLLDIPEMIGEGDRSEGGSMIEERSLEGIPEGSEEEESNDSVGSGKERVTAIERVEDSDSAPGGGEEEYKEEYVSDTDDSAPGGGVEEHKEEYSSGDDSDLKGSGGSSSVASAGVDASVGSISEDVNSLDDPEHEELEAALVRHDESADDSRYRVIGVTNKEEVIDGGTVNPAVISELTDTLAEVIDNITLADSIRETDSIISSMTESSSGTFRQETTAYTIIRQTSVFTAGRQVNNAHTTLQTACEIAKGPQNITRQLAQYALVYCFLRGYRSKESISAAMTEIKRNFKYNCFDIAVDMAIIYRWLNSSDITPGENIQDRAVSRLRSYAEKSFRGVQATPQVMPIGFKMKSFQEARKESQSDPNFKIGNLGKYFFYVDIEFIEDDDDDESSEGSDVEGSEDDDLEDFGPEGEFGLFGEGGQEEEY